MIPGNKKGLAHANPLSKFFKVSYYESQLLEVAAAVGQVQDASVLLLLPYMSTALQKQWLSKIPA
jgi:hypothetical protein